MELSTYLDHIGADGNALLVAATTNPRASIASCPDWDMTGLLRHTTVVHHWVTHILTTGTTEPPTRRFSDEAPTDWASLGPYFEEGLSALLAAFGAVTPDALVWNWFDEGPAPARFWFRRMAHETAMHRWDAQRGTGTPQPIDASLADDAVDEFVMFVQEWTRDHGVPGLHGSLALVATDTGTVRALDLEPTSLVWRDDATGTDATVRGTASDLLLFVGSRISLDDPVLSVAGDRGVAESWSAVSF
jgi:uncharacterized protein (TIGR03083 family)